MTENVDSVDLHVDTVEQVHAPYCGIHKSHAFDLDVITIVKLQISVRIRLVAMLTNAFLCAVIQNAVSVNTDILRVLRKNASVNERILLQINAFVGTQHDLSREMNALPEIMRNRVRIFARTRLIVEDIQEPVIIIQFQKISSVFLQHKDDLISPFFISDVFSIGLDHNTVICRLRQGFYGNLDLFVGNQIDKRSDFALCDRSLMTGPPGVEGICRNTASVYGNFRAVHENLIIL